MKKNIHVGQLVAQHIAENSISKAALARALKVSPSGIEYRMKRGVFPTAFLMALCHELQYNFFADIAQELPVTYGSKVEIDIAKETEIAQLKQEIAFLNREKELLSSLLKEPPKNNAHDTNS